MAEPGLAFYDKILPWQTKSILITDVSSLSFGVLYHICRKIAIKCFPYVGTGGKLKSADLEGCFCFLLEFFEIYGIIYSICEIEKET